MKTSLRSKHMQLLLLAYIGFITIAIPGGAFGLAWLYIQETFQVSLGALGILTAAMSAPRLVVSFFSGAIINRLGVGRYLLAGMGLLMLGTAGYILAPGWWLFMAMAVTGSIGGSAIINGLNTFIAANYNSRQMNWLHACFGLGATIGPLILTFIVLTQGLSWRLFYVVMLFLQLGIGLLILITRRDWLLNNGDEETAPETPGQPTAPARQITMLDTLRLPVVWLGIALFFVATGAETNAGQFTTILFVEGRGIDPAVAGRWLSIYWGSFMVGRLTTGIVIDRFDHARFLRVNMLWTIVGTLLLWANFSELASFIGLALMGFTLSPTAPTLYSDTPNLVGMRHSSNAIGFQNAGAGLGLALPPLLSSMLAERIGLETISPVLLVLAVLTFLLHEVMTLVNRHQPAAQPVTAKKHAT